MSFPEGVGVFLSAVSSEFGQVRSDIAEDLRTRGFEVKVQEEFTQDGVSETLLDRLDVYIQNCATVICVVGKRSGTIPTLAELEANKNDDLPKNIEQPSYTQWELILARRHKKGPYIYRALEPYKPEQEEATGPNDPDLQQRFVNWLFDERGANYGEFEDGKDLRILVFRAPLPLPPKVNGVSHEAVASPAGLRAEEAPGPEIRRRKDVLKPLPGDESWFIGRSTQKDQLEALIVKSREPVVAIVGPPGAGKKTLFSRVASELGLGSTLDDGTLIKPETEDQQSHEDLLQAIADQLYETDHPGAVPVKKRNQLLQEEHVRVFVADSSPDIIQQLRTAMPNARFFLTATEWGATEIFVPLAGFTDPDEMIKLFQDRYHAEVPLSVRDDIATMCGALDGLPSLIILLAIKAFKEAYVKAGADPRPLEAWAVELRGKTPDELRNALLPPSEARGVAETAKVVGVAVPEQVLVAITSAEALASAQSAGAVKADSPRYGVNTALDIVAADGSVMNEGLEHAVEWSERASGREIYANRAFVVRM
ncbi:MAG: DUF4062 domain-containing protein, partial [Actinobacteria bacterium]|nr:DUF4062 domain-containing protein [Actinomycetota bacterium]